MTTTAPDATRQSVAYAPSRGAPAVGAWDLSDVIRVPSRTREGLYHQVHVNVLAGSTDSCTCEAGQARKYCAHRMAVDSNEGSWGFRRCVECGSLCWLGRWYSGSGDYVAVFICPVDSEHSGHERAIDVLYRPTPGPPEYRTMVRGSGPMYAVGSCGSWRLEPPVDPDESIPFTITTLGFETLAEMEA